MTRLDPTAFPVRFSRLKLIAQSPQHYLHSLVADCDSSAMRSGRLVHKLVLGGPDSYAVYDGQRRGKAWHEFRIAHSHCEVFTRSEADKAKAIADAAVAGAPQFLACDGHAEETLHWHYGGRACRSTPDLFNDDILVDLKTTACASPRKWTGQWGEIRKRAYHAQLAFYLDAIEYCGHPRPKEAFLVAVETKPPHPVVTYRVCESELEEGKKLVHLWMEELRNCERSNHWPGYVQSVVDVEAPEPNEEVTFYFGDEEEEEAA